MDETYIQQINDVIRVKKIKPISNLEYEILRSILGCKTYYETSLKTGYTYGYIADLAYEIMKILSAHFDHPISKKNLLYFCRTYLSTIRV